jgi:hypothetical protein
MNMLPPHVKAQFRIKDRKAVYTADEVMNLLRNLQISFERENPSDSSEALTYAINHIKANSVPLEELPKHMQMTLLKSKEIYAEYCAALTKKEKKWILEKHGII